MGAFSIRTKTFRLNWADYRAMGLAEFSRSPAPWLPALLVLDGIATSLIQVRQVFINHGRDLAYAGVPLAGLAFTACVAVMIYYGLRRHCSRDPVLSGEQIVILDDGAVRLIGFGCETRQTWAAFDRIYRSRNYVFLHAPGQRTYILPKCALSSHDDLAGLVAAGRAGRRIARNAHSSLPRLPEMPDNREIWRSQPCRMLFYRPVGRMILKMLAISVPMPGLLLLGVVTRFGPGVLTQPDVLLIFLGAAAAVFAFCLLLLPMMWLVLRRYPELAGEREISFTRDYVRCTTPAFDSRVDWVNVRRVYRGDGVFFFRLVTGLFHVPASAFATRAEAEAFFAQAVAFWRAAEARR